MGRWPPDGQRQMPLYRPCVFRGGCAVCLEVPEGCSCRPTGRMIESIAPFVWKVRSVLSIPECTNEGARVDAAPPACRLCDDRGRRSPLASTVPGTPP